MNSSYIRDSKGSDFTLALLAEHGLIDCFAPTTPQKEDPLHPVARPIR